MCIKQTVHVCMDANNSSVCFCSGCFLRHIRRPLVIGLFQLALLAINEKPPNRKSPHDWLVMSFIDMATFSGI